MKETIINTLKASFEASIQKHKLNIDIMLNNPMAIHDHTDFMGAVELELAQIAEYEDKLETLIKHFGRDHE
jgi:molybdenum cofactor biosynthesis enzyme MoaA